MLSKILLAQRSGAKGVLLVDNGQCSVDLRDCGLIGGSDRVSTNDARLWVAWRGGLLHIAHFISP
jgi:hypothetical protein